MGFSLEDFVRNRLHLFLAVIFFLLATLLESDLPFLLLPKFFPQSLGCNFGLPHSLLLASPGLDGGDLGVTLLAGALLHRLLLFSDMLLLSFLLITPGLHVLRSLLCHALHLPGLSLGLGLGSSGFLLVFKCLDSSFTLLFLSLLDFVLRDLFLLHLTFVFGLDLLAMIFVLLGLPLHLIQLRLLFTKTGLEFLLLCMGHLEISNGLLCLDLCNALLRSFLTFLAFFA